MVVVYKLADIVDIAFIQIVYHNPLQLTHLQVAHQQVAHHQVRQPNDHTVNVVMRFMTNGAAIPTLMETVVGRVV